MIAEAMEDKWWRRTGPFWKWRTRTRQEATNYLSREVNEYGRIDLYHWEQLDDCEEIRDGASAMLKVGRPSDPKKTPMIELTRQEFRRISHWYLKP